MTSLKVAARSPWVYLAAVLVIAGLWAWTRRLPRWWFDIPESLRLQTLQGLVLITAAETTALHLDLFCNLTQMKPEQLVSFRPIPQQTVRQIHAKVRTQSAHQSQQKGLAFFVFRGDELVGSMGFSRLDPMTSSGELDLVIHKQYWDDGWAQDLHLSVLDYGFDNLRLHRILCGVDRSNRLVRTFYENLHFNLVSVGRAGSPNMYNYVITRQKYLEETRSSLVEGAMKIVINEAKPSNNNTQRLHTST